ncbi:MAG: hypothetical protein IPP37_10150 [Saprospiraceae bacterium]|nr:hypothetical protein [Saprospiraceae bacterium]
MKFSLSAVLCLFFYYSFCQSTYHFPGGASVQSLCGISVLLDGPETVYLNPASTVQIKSNTTIDASGGQLSGLSNRLQPGFGLIQKFKRSTFGMSITSSGMSEFRYSQLGISYARPLLKNLDLGIRFNGGSLRIKDYGSALQLSIDIGFTGTINKISNLGFFMTYPAYTNASGGLSFPVRMAGAYGYKPNPKTKMIIEVEKIEDRALSPKIGFVYQPINFLEIRLSTDFIRTMAGWGLGFKLKNNTLMTSYTYHRDLGGFMGISLQWMK